MLFRFQLQAYSGEIADDFNRPTSASYFFDDETAKGALAQADRVLAASMPGYKFRVFGCVPLPLEPL